MKILDNHQDYDSNIIKTSEKSFKKSSTFYPSGPQTGSESH